MGRTAFPRHIAIGPMEDANISPSDMLMINEAAVDLL